MRAIAEAGWGDPGKTTDTIERGLKGSSKGRIIVCGPNHEKCNDLAIERLSFREDAYVLGNTLSRDSGRAVSSMTPSNLQEMLSECVDWRSQNDKGELVPCHPPKWSVQEIYDRANWPTLREVEGFSDVPILRPNGSVVTEQGYDSITRVILSKGHTEIPMSVEEASAALAEVVVDVPFDTDSHRAAWLCSVLTPLALYAFSGPMPLFLFEASTAGAGKSKLAAITGLISSGRFPSIQVFKEDEAEQRKTITSFAMAPRPVLFFDNLTPQQILGGSSLTMLITSPDRTWSDRILGGNKNFDGKANFVIFATANQTRVAPDIERRVCPVRIVPLVERADLRRGFLHPDWEEWSTKNQEILMWAAIRLLQESIRVKPEVNEWGSFSNWSRLVIGACHLAGWGTPDAAREAFREDATTHIADDVSFVREWASICKVHDRGNGLKAEDMYALCYPSGPSGFSSRPAEGCESMRIFLDSVYPKGVTTRCIGSEIRKVRQKVTAYGRLTKTANSGGSGRWIVRK